MIHLPSDVQAEIDRAALLIASHRSDEAIAVLHGVLSSWPTAANAWAQLCAAHLAVADPESALQAALQASTLVPEEGWPLRLVSQAMTALSRPREALLFARRAVANDPMDWTCQLHLGFVLLSERKTSEASAIANRVAAMAPNAAAPYLLLAEVARKQRRHKDVEAYLRRARELDPLTTRS